MKRKICLITLILSVVLSGAPIVGVSLCNDDREASDVTISTNKSIFAPGDIMRVSVSVTASRIDMSVVDAYVVVRNPDGGFSTCYKKPGWIVVDKPLYEIVSIPLKNKRIGPYSLSFVLCPPGNDLFDISGLVAFANTEVFLLPDEDASFAEDKHTFFFSDPDSPYRSPLPDDEVIQFATSNNLFAVTMPVRRAFPFSLLQDLNRKGVPVYVHTINKIEVFKYLHRKGVHGIYTDKILPKDLHR